MSAQLGFAGSRQSAGGTEAERGLAFTDGFRMLYQRVGFVSLPFDKLTKLSLQTPRRDRSDRSRSKQSA